MCRAVAANSQRNNFSNSSKKFILLGQALVDTSFQESKAYSRRKAA
jgi:hypothetical protein